MTHRTSPKEYVQRGFALLVAVVLTSVILAVGAALVDIAYKQVLLSSSSKNSQIAFYRTDSALECALYWDQKFNAFDYNAPIALNNVTCDNLPVTAVPPTGSVGNLTSDSNGNLRLTTFTVTDSDPTCGSGGVAALVTIYKHQNGTTDIYSDGYSSCDTTLNTRIERGLKVHY